MGGGDYKKSKIRNYIGNNFGLGANNFGGNTGLTIPEGNNYGLGTNKFGGNVGINFPQGRTLYVPVVGTSVPPPPPPPSDTDIDCYVGNNFGLAGFDFAQPYTISSTPIYDKKGGGEASDTPKSPSVPPLVIPPAYPTIYPLQPSPGSDVDTYVGNNYGFGGNKFDGRYDINIGGGQTPPNRTISVSRVGEKIPRPGNSDNGHSPGPSAYTIPTGLVETFCPICNTEHIFP